MDKHEYSIKETLDILDISRATLYNKLDKYKLDITKHITTKSGKKYISQDGIRFLKNLENYQECVQTTKDNLDNLDNVQIVKDTLNNELISLIKRQVEDKDKYILELQQDKINLFKEIDTKNKQIEDQNRMLENNQILLQYSQQQILYLEESKNKETSWWKKIFF